MTTRRNLLTAAALGVTGLSGCASLGDDSGGPGGTSTTQRTVTTTAGPAQFDVAIEAPTDPSLDEPVELTVSAANGGGQQGTFSGAIQVSGPEQLTESVTMDVAPGDVGETTVEIDPAYAGTYTARVQGTDAQAELTVPPRDPPVGESIAVDDDLLVRVDTLRVESTLFAEGLGPQYRSPGVPSILPAEDPAETVLLVVDGAVRNFGDEPKTFDAGGVTIDVGGDVEATPEFYTDMGEEISPGVPIGGAKPRVEGPPLAGADVEPGEVLVGWLLAPIPREVATQARVDVAVQRDGEGPPEARWEAIPEGGMDLPTFEAENLSLPDRVPNLTTQEFSVTVTNTGASAGTYRDVVEIPSILPDLDPVGRVTGEVAPGETVELTSEFTMLWGGRHGVRLQAASPDPVIEDAGLEFGALCEGTWLELGFGETATLPTGVEVTLGSPIFNQGLSYGSGPEFGRSTSALIAAVTATLPEWARGEELGQTLLPALADFEYKFDSNQPIPALRVGSKDAQEKAQKGGYTLNSPVQGDLYPRSPPENLAERSLQGWIELVNPDEGWPDDEREIQFTKVLKSGSDNLEKKVGIKWSKKY